MNQASSAPALPGRRQLEVFLQPGEYFVGDASHRIHTVLGSCVSITLWNPSSRVGAMSHFLLATRGKVAQADIDEHVLDARYGDEALRLMLRDLSRRQPPAPPSQAKIFGGGDMFPDHKMRGLLTIGRRNGDAARDLLQVQGIEVVSECLFGEGHRQITFDIGTGDVWSRQARPRSEFGALASAS